MGIRIAGKDLLRALLVVGMITVLLLPACAPATEPGEGNVVEIGLAIAVTGPAASAEKYVLMTVQDYIRYFNEEVGIPGGAIKLSWIDTGHEPAKGVSAYHRFVERGAVILMSIVEDDTVAFMPMCARDEVPLFSAAISDVTLYPPSWVYAVYPTNAERFAVVCDWIKESWKEERPPRVALIGPDGAYSRQPDTLSIRYAESVGIEMLPREVVAYVPIDTTSQLLRLNENGADYVYITSIWTTALPVMKDAQRLGLIDEMVFGGYENTQCEALIGGLGPLAEGYFAQRVAPWWKETQVPGVKLVTDLQMKYHGKVDQQGDEADVLRMVSVMCEAIRRAVENVGYENLDGHAVKEALDSIKDWDPYGIGPITYTPEDHRGCDRVRIYQVQEGEVVPITDWQEAPMLKP